MERLAVIVGFGGYNAAGRSSFHHGYKFMVKDSLPCKLRQETLAGLAVMMNLVSVKDGCFLNDQEQVLSLADIESQYLSQIEQGTLVRRIEKDHFDCDAAPLQKTVQLSGADNEPLHFTLAVKSLPSPIPHSWTVTQLADETRVQVCIPELAVSIASTSEMPVKSAGQLPTGFDPAKLYPSRFHPRGLQLAITGASDALHSVGIDWSTLSQSVAADEIAVFAGSGMSQLDRHGLGGMMQARLRGQRVSAKQLPLGLNTMPADFINAYVLGSLGNTGSTTGACASFLYNLQRGVDAIRHGSARIVLVGNTEAPIIPEVIEGYAAMGALATDKNLAKLDGKDTVDHRRASRPFGENCGFTLAESCQFVVLMDDALALELGANIHGAVPQVFINADGTKKSISAPGVGNYLSMMKAVSLAEQLLGSDTIQNHSFVHAHGSSTPMNRTSEANLLTDVAKHFNIKSWPLTAVKSYVGHPLAPASGDQLMSALGTFEHQIIPGINTLDKVADDVDQSILRINQHDTDVSQLPMQVAFLNAKGFGGNNASAPVLSPIVVNSMLLKRHGSQAMTDYQLKRLSVIRQAHAYDQKALKGAFDVIYRFGDALLDQQNLTLGEEIGVTGFAKNIKLKVKHGFADMCE